MPYIIMKIRSIAIVLFFAMVSFAKIETVCLFVNYGGPYHPPAVDIFKNMAIALSNEHGFQLTISTRDQTNNALANLQKFDLVLFANTGNGGWTNTGDQDKLKNFFLSGGRAVGYHATIDHGNYWDWWDKELHSDCNFTGHGNSTFSLKQDAEMDRLPALKKMWAENHLGDANISSTEIYTLDNYARGKAGVTIMQTVAPPHNVRPSHDFTWHKDIGQGQYIITCLGHGPADFEGGWLQKATWAWMKYLNGQYTEVVGCMEPDASNFNPLAATACADNCCEYAACCKTPGYKEYDANCKNPQQPMCVNLGASTVPVKAHQVAHSKARLSITYRDRYSIHINNTKGKTVLRESAQGAREYDLNDFQSGIYFVYVNSASGSVIKRILIN